MSARTPSHATTRRHFVQWLTATGATTALIGCEPAGEFVALMTDAEPDGDFTPSASDAIDDVAHHLNRLTWGPRPGEYQRVRSLGVEAFIDEQLDPDAITDRRADWKTASIESVHAPAGELYEHNEDQLLVDLTRHKMLRGTYSRRQLYEVMVDFWSDHFNIVSDKGDCKWLKVADEREVIRRHALGRFADLVRASAVSPAMLIYLDGHDNKVVEPGDRPNENYARELLELHTLGVHGGYTQRDVMEVARALSGWTYQHRPLQFRGATVAFAPDRHDQGEKIVLGQRIPAGGGAADLDRVVEIACRHASTARHIAEKLCRRFIADPAPPDAVQAVAETFGASDGDIRATLRTLFATEAFRTSRGTLFKRPLRYMISALRATRARTRMAPDLLTYLDRMGQAPFQYPTPDGYPMEAGPWLGTLLWRWNFALALTDNRLPGTTIDAEFLAQHDAGAKGGAILLGRRPTEREAGILRTSGAPLALCLASPAFQRH